MLNIKEEYDKCWHCESFYGPCFGEPLCVTCHLFLYANTNTIEDIDATSTTTTTTTAASTTTTSGSGSETTVTTPGGLQATTSSNDSNIAASSSSNTTNASNSSSLRSVNQVQNMIHKLELNDSGNEDIDSDQLNQESATTTTVVTTNEESRNDFDDDEENDDHDNDDDDEDDNNDRNNNRSRNSSNVFDDDERRQQQQQQQQPAQQQRTSPRKRRRRSPVGAAQAASASYYAMQYSRKQLNSLIRNGRINNNNNINNVNNNRQQLVPGNRQRQQQQQQANLNSLSNNNNNNTVSSRIFSSSCAKRRDDPLGEQIALLTSFNSSCTAQQRQPTSDLINILPTEVLWNIFKKLDDLSLWSASRVCKRWHELVSQEVSEDAWRAFIGARWVFFRSAVRVKCYQTLYSQLVQSSNCFYCLQHIHNRPNSQCSDELKKSWRHKRLLLELKALHQDPMSGINARPLDASCYYWQASITGPVGSPYEGGVFYLFLKIPQSYPLNPPLVRFVTRIYHPNISKHGDIGLDSIHENWSLALTISKVLISIQSLLTDPYTRVCMEHDIGRLYTSNRDVYERNARYYTWKYAMSDYVQFDAYNINNYDNQFLLLNNQLTTTNPTGFGGDDENNDDELTCNNYHNENNNDRNSSQFGSSSGGGGESSSNTTITPNLV